jgi:hypothetical protein
MTVEDDPGEPVTDHVPSMHQELLAARLAGFATLAVTLADELVAGQHTRVSNAAAAAARSGAA